MVLDFNVALSEKANIPVVQVMGEIDLYTSSQLNDTLSQAVEKGQSLVVLNLEEVHFIDSTGLGTIASHAESFSHKGGHIHVVCSKLQLKKIFDVSGLSQTIVQLFEEESAALQKR